MIHEKPLEIYCYQLKSILKGKHKTNQKDTTQNDSKYITQVVLPPSYEFESKDLATETKKDNVAVKKCQARNICKCKPIKTNEDYLKYQNYVTSPVIEVNNDNLAIKKNNKNRFSLFSKKKGTYQVNPKKRSLISLYRKCKKDNRELKDENTNTAKSKDEYQNKNAQEVEVTKYIDNKKNKKNKKSTIDKMQKLNKKTKKSRNVKFNFESTDDTCPQGVCRNIVDKGKHHHCKCDKTKVNKKLKKKHKQSTQYTNPITTCTEDICNVDSGKYKRDKDIKYLSKIGAGDQIIKAKKKCNNVLSALFKQNYQNKMPPAAPMLAIKVNSSNFQVLNSAEIKRKVKAMGKVEKNNMCVCPSRLEKEKYYGIGDTCHAGVCESAGKDKYSRFNCKCAKKTIIECGDTTCDRPLNIKHIKMDTTKNIMNSYLSPKTNEPMFKMVLDNNQMNILNMGEIEDVIRTASYTDICPKGICNDSARNKRAILNCKCINKKILPALHECDAHTCRPKKSLFYIICSRIFSRSDTWHRGYHANHRQALELGRNINHRHPVNRNRQNVTRGDGLKRNLQYNNGVECMCNCECNKKSKIKPTTQKKIKRKTKVKRSGFFQKDAMAKKFHQSEAKFSAIKKKRAKEETRKEREEQRKQLKLRREIDKLARKEADDSNFLANLLNGIFNLTIQTVTQLFKVIIRIIFDPINSYIYTKDRINNPKDSAKSFKRWLVETWKSKESKFSKTITDSDALNVLADHLEDSVVFQTFANKGRTKVERQVYERKKKLRHRRMRRRDDQALYGCRHMLLTTLRKHPCIWVYHICPNFYPQCLSLLSFCGNFLHVFIYLGALLCWTPCIMTMELVRACLCCMVCTQ